MTTEPLKSNIYPSPSVLWGWVALVLTLSVTILGFTPYTHNLDDIKVTLLHVLGGGSLVLFCWLWMRNEVSLPNRWVMIPLAGWFLSLIGTTVLHSLHLVPNYNPFQWIGWIMVGQYLALLGLFMLQATTMRTFRMVELSLLFWVTVVFVECAFGLLHHSGFFKVLYQFLYFGRQQSGPFASLLLTFGRTNDMLGTVLNRQFFGDLLAMWAPLCLAGAVIWTDLRRRIFAIVALILSFPCTYLTFSKATLPFYMGALVMTAIGIYAFTHYRKLRIPHLPYVLSGIVVVVATLFFFTFDQLAERFKTVDVSLDSRVIIWKGGIDIFKSHPILGAGPGCFRVLFPEFRDPDYHLSQISNVTLWAHNRLVDLLAEQGILGTLLYLALLGGIFYQGYRVLRYAKDERLKVIAIALVWGLLAFLATALFHPGVRWIIGAAPFWAILGMLAGLGKAEEWHDHEEGGPRRRSRGLLPSQRTLRVAALGAALFVWLNPFPLSHPFLGSNLGYGIRYFQGARENNLGLLMAESNRPEVAIQRYSKSLQWNPTFITAYYKRAHSENVMNDYEAALKTYLELMRYAPHYSEIHYNLGVIYRVRSEAAFEEGFKRTEQEERDTYFLMAAEYMQNSRDQYALAAKMSNKISIQYGYANLLERSARMETDSDKSREFTKQAAAVYNRIRELPLTFATQEENQLEVETKMKDFAKRRAPQLFEEAGAFAEAAESYRQVFRDQPGNLTYLRKTIEMFQRSGQVDRAILVLNAAISRSALNFEARNLLAEVLADQANDESMQEALRQSRILGLLNEEFPGEIPNTIQTQNARRRANLEKKLLVEAAPKTD